MLVIKRSKKAQKYSETKVRNSILKTFETCDSTIEAEKLDELIAGLPIKHGMRTEDIQTLIEIALMSNGYYREAKFFIIHRHIHYYENYLGNKVKFIGDYLSALNPASGSKYDSNANVTDLNLATLAGELFKGDIIQLNRYRLHGMISKMFGKELADEYIRQLEEHEIYKHDESSLYPYCVAVSMYPYLLNGLKDLGGLSATPQNLNSYSGTFINMVFATSAQFAGAVATAEFLLYFDYFARKDLGQNYSTSYEEFVFHGPILREIEKKSGKYISNFNELRKFAQTTEDPELRAKASNLIELTDEDKFGTKLDDGTRTIKGYIHQHFQQIVYSLNQPAAARNYQSTFWNISYFDRYYYEGIFGGFRFPDGSTPNWDSLSWLQKDFMKWFNKERTKTVLTFPVESMALLTDGVDDFKDKEYADYTAEMYAEGHSFFTYMSDNPDSLSSCCRLRNGISENTFSYTLGAGGVATGSKSVMTINLNRLVQNAVRNKKNYIDALREQVRKVHKYQLAFNELLKEFYEMDAMPVYKAGFIHMNKQYLTVGINGMVEAAEFLGIEIGPNKTYNEFVDGILLVLHDENLEAKTKEIMFNTEMVPAENLGAKFYKWDKEMGYQVPSDRKVYNSYFFKVEDTNTTIIDKLRLHGREFVKYLDGGSACHINLEEHLTKQQYRQVMKTAAKLGTNYFTFNIPNTVCPHCGHIDKRYLKSCPNCGSTDVQYATRIIGYLKLIDNFGKIRQEEAATRYYANGRKILSEQDYLLYFSDMNYYMALIVCDQFMKSDESFKDFRDRIKVINEGSQVIIDGNTYEWIEKDNSIEII